MNNNEEFYEEVATILDTQHHSNPFPYRYRTRWNNRAAGSGRFAGRGIVRCFGDQVHIALVEPNINKICSSKQEALELLRENI